MLVPRVMEGRQAVGRGRRMLCCKSLLARTQPLLLLALIESLLLLALTAQSGPDNRLLLAWTESLLLLARSERLLLLTSAPSLTLRRRVCHWGCKGWGC